MPSAGAGWIARRWGRAWASACCVLLALGMAGSLLLGGLGVATVAALVLWGIAHTALFPLCQVRVMRAAPQAQALAVTLNVTAANAGIGLGALAGGASIDHWGLASLGWVAAAIALAAIALGALLACWRRD